MFNDKRKWKLNWNRSIYKSLAHEFQNMQSIPVENRFCPRPTVQRSSPTGGVMYGAAVEGPADIDTC